MAHLSSVERTFNSDSSFSSRRWDARARFSSGGPGFPDRRVVFRLGFSNDGVGPLDDSIVLGIVFNSDSGGLLLDNIPQHAKILDGHSAQGFHLNLFPDFLRRFSPVMSRWIGTASATRKLSLSPSPTRPLSENHGPGT
jgi:hypothetical protein